MSGAACQAKNDTTTDAVIKSPIDLVSDQTCGCTHTLHESSVRVND